MTDLEKFQKEHGPAYRKLTQNPAFQAAMQLLNVRLIDWLANLSDEAIEKNSRQILGHARGQFSHENDMMNLYEKKEFGLPVEDSDEYYSPEQIAEMQSLIARFKEDQKRAKNA